MNYIENFSNLGFVVAAGGVSRRFGKNDKLFANFAEKPLFVHVLSTLKKYIHQDNIVLVCHPERLFDFKKKSDEFFPDWKPRILEGGVTRMHSVANGLKALPDNLEYVGVQDAARPFLSFKMIDSCYSEAERCGSGVIAKKISDTVKECDRDLFVRNTVDRESLYTVETPQIFSYSKLKVAYEKAFSAKFAITDDAGVMEYAGYPVNLVISREFNIKITDPEDFLLAEKIF